MDTMTADRMEAEEQEEVARAYEQYLAESDGSLERWIDQVLCRKGVSDG